MLTIKRMTPQLGVALLGLMWSVNGSVGLAEDWGSVKGRIVWSAAELPKPLDLDVSKDGDHCLKKGPLKDETYVVDPTSRGVKNAFVYFRFRGQPAIHPTYPSNKQQVEDRFKADFQKLNGFAFDELKAKVASGVKLGTIKAPVLLDQLQCTYVPHALAIREGQPLLAVNKEPIAHNIKVSSLSGKNDANPILPPGTFEIFRWGEEKSVINVECSIHGWMRMHAMVFDHPYYAITNANGEFSIENVPAGEQDLALRLGANTFIDASKGGKGTARGAKVKIESAKIVDLGDIKFSP